MRSQEDARPNAAERLTDLASQLSPGVDAEPISMKRLDFAAFSDAIDSIA
jgi:hypothetical protein